MLPFPHCPSTAPFQSIAPAQHSTTLLFDTCASKQGTNMLQHVLKFLVYMSGVGSHGQFAPLYPPIPTTPLIMTFYLTQHCCSGVNPCNRLSQECARVPKPHPHMLYLCCCLPQWGCQWACDWLCVLPCRGCYAAWLHVGSAMCSRPLTFAYQAVIVYVGDSQTCTLLCYMHVSISNHVV